MRLRQLIVVIFTLLFWTRPACAQLDIDINDLFGDAVDPELIEDDSGKNDVPDLGDMPRLGDSLEKRKKAAGQVTETQDPPPLSPDLGEIGFKPPPDAALPKKREPAPVAASRKFERIPATSGTPQPTQNSSAPAPVDPLNDLAGLPPAPGNVANSANSSSISDFFDMFGEDVDNTQSADMPETAQTAPPPSQSAIPDLGGGLGQQKQTPVSAAPSQRSVPVSNSIPQLLPPQQSTVPDLGLDNMMPPQQPAPTQPAFSQPPPGGYNQPVPEIGMVDLGVPMLGEEESQDLFDDMVPPSYGSNAAIFDIAGVMLKMSVEQAENAAKRSGYIKKSEDLEIPNFLEWRYEAKCRAQGVIGLEKLSRCVIKTAQEKNEQFVSKINFEKPQSRETLSLHFSSSFTKNRVQKIIYRATPDLSFSDTPKVVYLREIWKNNFWRRINRKYGWPDDEERVMWGLGENKPYLVASTGYLMLEDPYLPELDAVAMSRADKTTVNADMFTF